jgi:hypothetical protein
MVRRGEGPIAGLRRARTLSFGFKLEVTGGGDGKEDRVGESWPIAGSSNEMKLESVTGTGWRTSSLGSVWVGGLACTLFLKCGESA